jgi:phosphate acyltransferase
MRKRGASRARIFARTFTEEKTDPAAEGAPNVVLQEKAGSGGRFRACCARRKRVPGVALRREAAIVAPRRAPPARTRLGRSDEGMASDVRIALDVMGGDYGPAVAVAAAAVALERRPDLRFLLYGEEKAVAPILARHSRLASKSRIFHTDVAVKMSDKPSQALRTGRRVSSMWQALEAVKSGAADCAVSAGNTGALMAMAKFCLHTMSPIERPAIAAMWPTLRGESIVLDVGATIGADAQHLVDLAVMGAAMARIVFDIDSPTVGLLNVGVEEIKGVEEVRAAARILREANLPNMRYHGFVEGDDLGKGAVDVFVTEGFTGNIALKTAEGTARQLGQYMRDAMSYSLMSRIGFLFARNAVAALRAKMGPRVSGGVFLGLDGVVIKAHGGADAESYAGAVELGYDMVRQELLGKIREMIAQANGFRPMPAHSRAAQS